MGDSEQNASDPELQQWVGELAETVPGYSAYAELEKRRETDQALCNFLLGVARDFMHHAGTLEAYLMQNQPGALGARARQTTHDLEMLCEKIGSAPYAYSPLFTVGWVPVDTQRRMVECDRQLVDVAREVLKLLEPTLTDDTDFEEIVAACNQAVRALDDQVEERLMAIMEYQG